MIERKQIRLLKYDYSKNGYYFITICTISKENIFWDTVGAPTGRPPQLTAIGIVVKKAIINIPILYTDIILDNYVIMPNHIHIILIIRNKDGGRPVGAPTLGTVINHMKGFVTKTVGKPIWQKSFYDHIIRNEKSYQEIWQYIDENPAKWEQDRYYIE